jgi:hypothetical protein
VDSGATLAFAADGLAVAAGSFNTVWLAGYWLGNGRCGPRRYYRRPRRLAALTLALLNAGVAVQAGFAQAMFSAHRFGWDIAPFFATAPWLASRVALVAGTLLLSLLIVRRAER